MNKYYMSILVSIGLLNLKNNYSKTNNYILMTKYLNILNIYY